MKIEFWKMHGAANDFIMVDDREETFPIADQNWIGSVASRRTGVGCEGVILIQPSDSSDFRMRFFNPDGSEVEMCGNGARCIARLASDIGAAGSEMTIDTIAGELKATVTGPSVVLGMTAPVDWAMNQSIVLGGDNFEYSSVNTGVPHAVFVVEDVADVDIRKLGAEVRYHDVFSPTGTNANFLQVTDGQSIKVRTYERGVEDETLACGTGMTACALVAAKMGLVTGPVTVIPASGDKLAVDFTLSDDGAADVTLTGPAEYVFTGTLEYPG
jgi:diaminopimelate epimerase